jgi:hypothetical protein
MVSMDEGGGQIGTDPLVSPELTVRRKEGRGGAATYVSLASFETDFFFEAWKVGRGWSGREEGEGTGGREEGGKGRGGEEQGRLVGGKGRGKEGVPRRQIVHVDVNLASFETHFFCSCTHAIRG